jgi:hypothetical protein
MHSNWSLLILTPSLMIRLKRFGCGNKLPEFGHKEKRVGDNALLLSSASRPWLWRRGGGRRPCRTG